MQTFDQSLMDLYRKGWITLEDAIIRATNPDDFKLKIAGILSAGDTTWEGVKAGDEKYMSRLRDAQTMEDLTKGEEEEGKDKKGDEFDFGDFNGKDPFEI